jgi:hypothetical protein
LLASHFAAAKVLLESPKLSLDLKQFILRFSYGVGRREVAQHVSRVISSQDEPVAQAELGGIIDEMWDIAMSDSELARPVAVLAGSGVVAMMLRWPETESFVKDVFSKVVSTLDKPAGEMLLIDEIERAMSAVVSKSLQMERAYQRAA